MATLKYYNMPLNFSTLTQRAKRLGKCDLKESVIQHIYLILSTKYEDSRFDSLYGCELSKYDFENPNNLERIKHQLEKSVKDLLVAYEKRITETKVTIHIKEEELSTQGIKKHRKLKKKVEITVIGKFIATNQKFEPPPFVIYLSPIAVNARNKT